MPRWAPMLQRVGRVPGEYPRQQVGENWMHNVQGSCNSIKSHILGHVWAINDQNIQGTVFVKNWKNSIWTRAFIFQVKPEEGLNPEEEEGELALWSPDVKLIQLEKDKNGLGFSILDYQVYSSV